MNVPANKWMFTCCLLAGCATAGGTRSGGSFDQALEAFRAGDFDRAEALCPAPGDVDSRLLRARLCLLRNRGREAAEVLFPLVAPFEPFGPKKATWSGDSYLVSVYPELALAFLRSDEFRQAATIYQAIGENILAAKYGALARSVPYLLSTTATETTVELLGTDPLPHVALGVNGRVGTFLIDTSLDEVVVERDFAKRAGLKGLGMRTDALRVTYDETTADEISLGRLTIRNIPVHLGRLALVSRMKVDGAVGLGFLLHFDFTLDYRRARLVLRPPGGAVPGGLPAALAGDRYLLVKGSVNGQPGAWLAINTAMPDVVAAVSEGFVAALGGTIQEITTGPLRLTSPPLDPAPFPVGLDGAYGPRVGFMLGQNAFRDHSIRLEPRSMRMLIE